MPARRRRVDLERGELVSAKRWMASEVCHLATRLDAMTLVDWWLLRPLLEDAVANLDEAVRLRPVAGADPLSDASDEGRRS